MAASPVAAVAASREGLGLRRLAAYVELTKPRVTVLILLVAAASFRLAALGAPPVSSLADLLAAVAALAGGIFALNQWLERGLDGRMRRTRSRPLPAGRLAPREALWFGSALSVLSLALFLFRVNAPAALAAALTLAGYLFVYTPLKTRSPHSTAAGAIPGAAPPLIGWLAARGEAGAEAWILFAILFLWQFPHFHSIGLLYEDDYARAGVRLWAVIERDGKTLGRQILGGALLLAPVSLLPAVFGVTGILYLGGAAVLGMGYLYVSARTAACRSRVWARRLLLASVVYLPALFALMVLDRG